MNVYDLAPHCSNGVSSFTKNWIYFCMWLYLCPLMCSKRNVANMWAMFSRSLGDAGGSYGRNMMVGTQEFGDLRVFLINWYHGRMNLSTSVWFGDRGYLFWHICICIYICVIVCFELANKTKHLFVIYIYITIVIITITVFSFISTNIIICLIYIYIHAWYN
jgi:hypothetical protein